MSKINFYHLQKQPLENVLPKLLEKAYATGVNTIVRIGNPERVEFINGILWSFEEQSFLPHGSKKDGNAQMQPIWLTSVSENPNNAEMLFLVDGANLEDDDIEEFSRIFVIFDGASEEALTQARSMWKKVKSTDHECSYWQQDAQGKWQKSA